MPIRVFVPDRLPAPEPGPLALTWPGKDFALLPADATATYEWVPVDDPRVCEPPALVDVALLGKVGLTRPDARRAEDNLLIRGDACRALTALNRLPEFAAEYRGKVKLCYIDPPFNTGQAFTRYDDKLDHAMWLTMMRDRLTQIYELLAEDGSVWVHLDDVESHYVRVILDEVFGRQNFLADVIWERKVATGMLSANFSRNHDTILVYAKNLRQWAPNHKVIAADTERYPHEENGRRYRLTPLRKVGAMDRREDSPAMFFPLTAPDGTEVFPKRSDGSDGCWRWGRTKCATETDRIRWSQVNGEWRPSTVTWQPSDGKDYMPWRDLWLASDGIGQNSQGKREIKALFPHEHPFDTPKPESLLHRVITIGSQPGDIVLDCFAGSGTTAAVAHKMERRWVTVEWSASTLVTFTEPRLRKVVEGADSGGVTDLVGWSGGGGFRVLEAVTPPGGDEPAADAARASVSDLAQSLSVQRGKESAAGAAAREASEVRAAALWAAASGGQESLFA